MNSKAYLRVNEILTERNMTKVKLAELMNTSKENLNGKLKSPSFPTLVAIANALQVPMWRLFATREEVAQIANHQSEIPALLEEVNQRLARIEEILAKSRPQ